MPSADWKIAAIIFNESEGEGERERERVPTKWENGE
jgi:hypothetical protein